MYLTWCPPLENLQNGDITEYKIRYSGKDDNGSELLTNKTYYLLKRLGKYTWYNISVEARTKVGFGPLKYISVTTLEDGIKLIYILSLIPFHFLAFLGRKNHHSLHKHTDLNLIIKNRKGLNILAKGSSERSLLIIILHMFLSFLKVQKQSFTDVLQKRCC